jgi:hypothetical protein
MTEDEAAFKLPTGEMEDVVTRNDETAAARVVAAFETLLLPLSLQLAHPRVPAEGVGDPPPRADNCLDRPPPPRPGLILGVVGPVRCHRSERFGTGTHSCSSDRRLRRAPALTWSVPTQPAVVTLRIGIRVVPSRSRPGATAVFRNPFVSIRPWSKREPP